MRQWTVAVLLLAACSGRDTTPAGEALDHVGDAAAHGVLVTRRLSPEAKLCTRGAIACEVPDATSGGMVASNGDALVRVVGGRSSQVVLVRAGHDSAVAFGRDGAGPGEYRAPVEIGLDDAGNVHVFDLFTRRLLRFAPDGTPIREGIGQLPPAPHPAMSFVNGELWMPSAENPAAKGDTLPVFIYAFTDAGAARQRHAIDLRLSVFGVGEFRPLTVTLAPVPQFAFGRDGRLVYAEGATAEITLFDATGRLAARGGFRTQGRPVTEADLEVEIARRLRGLPPGQMREQMLQAMRESANRHPGVTQLRVMADGEVWAREAPEAGTDSVSWLVYSATLAPQARVRMGVDDIPVGVHGGRVLLSRSGEDEESTGYWWMRLAP
jgi:hypothetical protein